MSYEISRTNNGDNSGLAIANIKKSQCLTWRGKREGIAIVNDTMLKEARERSGVYTQVVKIEAVAQKAKKKEEGVMKITSNHSDFKEKLEEQTTSPGVLKKADSILAEIYEEAINEIRNMK